jgi:LysM repeat protein
MLPAQKQPRHGYTARHYKFNPTCIPRFAKRLKKSLSSSINNPHTASLLRTSLFVGFFVAIIFFGLSHAQAQGTGTSSAVETSSSDVDYLTSHCSNPDPKACAPSTELADNDDALLADAAPSGSQAFTDINSSDTGQISVYVVRQGDTLASIAQMFGVTTNTIIWANDIKGGKVSVGDQLVILPISGISHTVVKGDTLQSIAKKYGADLGDILSYNGLSEDDNLTIGQVIIVPDGELSSAPSSSTSSSSSGSSSALGGSVNSCGLKISNYEKLLVNPCKYPSYPGYYARPIAGGVKTQNLHGYNAVDLASPVGTSIHAAADGKIIVLKDNSAWNGGYGNYIVISHPNGTQTLYAHMRNTETGLSVGSVVTQGETIGYIGMTGETTGPHVHFEVRGARNPF